MTLRTIIELIGRPHPQWSIDRAIIVAGRRRVDPALALALGRCRALTGTRREWLKAEAGTNEVPA